MLERLAVTGADLVTLQEAKDWLRLLNDAEDDVVQAALDAAVRVVEDEFNLTGPVSTWRHQSTGGSVLFLPRPPIRSVTTFEEWRDRAWVSLDVEDLRERSSGVYESAGGFPARFRVTYEAGYVPGEEPADLRAAILTALSWRFHHRGEEAMHIGVSGASGEAPRLRSLYPGLWVPAL